LTKSIAPPSDGGTTKVQSGVLSVENYFDNMGAGELFDVVYRVRQSAHTAIVALG
jgi:hypothetical protein